MKSLHSLVSRLCEPTNEKHPDPKAKQVQWKKNIANFSGFGTATLLFILFLPFPSSSSVYLFNTFANLGTFITFLILCRSYAKVFNILYTMFISFVGFPLFTYLDDFVFIYVGYVFSLPALLMLLHGNIKLSLCTCGMQLVLMSLKMKDALMKSLERYSLEEFANHLTGTTLIIFLALLLMQLSLMQHSNEVVIEMHKAQTVTEEVLEKQRTFIFSFSHELRNPINSLLGNLQLVLMGGTSASATREMVNTAKVCGEILLQAINNVLDTGKFEMGNLEVNPVPTRISELFQRPWTMYQELLRQKKLRSSLKIEKSIFPMLRIDAMKVNQILSNLIGNAIKFTEKGSINLTVEWIQKERVNDECFDPEPYDEIDERIHDKDENISLTNKKYRDPFSNYLKIGEEKSTWNSDELIYPREEVKGVLKISVQDTGFGMKPNCLEKLFKKFSQVSEDVTRRQIGTGLGLFITKEICKAMKGDVRAYSQYGVGTTFVVCLPTVAIPLSNSSRANSQSMIDKLKEKKIRTIVADDSPFNVKLTCNYFLQLGAQVVSVAYNGEDAYTKYRESQAKSDQIDLIALDIDMPKLNGKQVCDKIRKYEKENGLKPIKIIFISGNYDKEQMNEYLDMSRGLKANLFLKKPTTFEDFTTAIYKLIIRD